MIRKKLEDISLRIAELEGNSSWHINQVIGFKKRSISKGKVLELISRHRQELRELHIQVIGLRELIENGREEGRPPYTIEELGLPISEVIAMRSNKREET